MEQTLKIRNKKLDFTNNTYIMGIINCTPDSFYAESRKKNLNTGKDTAMDMIKSGVDIIDIGGESSRPGSDSVTVEEELERVIPLIESIRKESDVIISIDTVKPVVAEKAIKAGADILNDISGFKLNNGLEKMAADYEVPVILMHMRGTPKTMQDKPYYKDTIYEICNELNESVNIAISAGIKKEKIIIDPGIGFSKRFKDNLIIIRDLKKIKAMGYPVLIGLSRKSFLGTILENEVEDRMIGTITANTIAVINGADIIRVHDYKETADMVKVISAVYNDDI